MNTELKVQPTEIWINRMPGGAGAQIQPRDVNLTLIVTNQNRTDYHTDHPNSGIFRFWVMQDGSEIWHSPNATLQVVTPVDIPAGQSIDGSQIWHIPDVRKLSLGQCLAYGEFVPTGDRADGTITVDEAV